MQRPFDLRPATAADLDLTFAITEDAMRGYVEATWGRWDAAEQRATHEANFTPATHRIIEVSTGSLADAVLARAVADDRARADAGWVPAGFVAVEDLPEHLWLVKLDLLAPFRGRGLGSAVLRRVMADAAALGKPLYLRVLRVNTGAQALYRRHGFEVVGETPERLFMQWAPPGGTR
jgi:ribosomal protein S18 acetylase RimI-like enzyme